jgi:hypothetical protein
MVRSCCRLGQAHDRNSERIAGLTSRVLKGILPARSSLNNVLCRFHRVRLVKSNSLLCVCGTYHKARLETPVGISRVSQRKCLQVPPSHILATCRRGSNALIGMLGRTEA